MGRGLRRREPGLHGRAPCRGAGNRAFFRRATFADASLQKRRGGGNVEKISGQAERSFFIKRTQPCVHAACFSRHVRKEKHTALFRSVRRIFRGIYEKEEGKIMALQAVTFFLPLFHRMMCMSRRVFLRRKKNREKDKCDLRALHRL